MSAMKKMVTDICEDILNRTGNFWINNSIIEIYIRSPGYHLVGDVTVPFVDIANVTVSERRRGQGMFKALLDYLEADVNVYVENVFNEHLAECLEGRGYKRLLADGNECPRGELTKHLLCYYKLNGNAMDT